MERASRQDTDHVRDTRHHRNIEINILFHFFSVFLLNLTRQFSKTSFSFKRPVLPRLQNGHEFLPLFPWKYQPRCPLPDAGRESLLRMRAQQSE